MVFSVSDRNQVPTTMTISFRMAWTNAGKTLFRKQNNQKTSKHEKHWFESINFKWETISCAEWINKLYFLNEPKLVCCHLDELIIDWMRLWDKKFFHIPLNHSASTLHMHWLLLSFSCSASFNNSSLKKQNWVIEFNYNCVNIIGVQRFCWCHTVKVQNIKIYCRFDGKHYGIIGISKMCAPNIWLLKNVFYALMLRKINKRFSKILNDST